ncbi:MAG: hypothetical protein ABF289_15845 [Clostridiales bacterium]
MILKFSYAFTLDVFYINKDGSYILYDNFSTFNFSGELYINRENDSFWIYIPGIEVNLTGEGTSLNTLFNQYISDELNRRNTYEIGNLNSN